MNTLPICWSFRKGQGEKKKCEKSTGNEKLQMAVVKKKKKKEKIWKCVLMAEL